MSIRRQTRSSHPLRFAQGVNLFELLESVRVVVDQRVFQTSVQLSRILNVERVATDTPAMSGVMVRHECDRTELETKRQRGRVGMNRSFERERTPVEISAPKMDKKSRRVVFRRKKFTPKRINPP